MCKSLLGEGGGGGGGKGLIVKGLIVTSDISRGLLFTSAWPAGIWCILGISRLRFSAIIHTQTLV